MSRTQSNQFPAAEPIGECNQVNQVKRSDEGLSKHKLVIPQIPVTQTQVSEVDNWMDMFPESSSDEEDILLADSDFWNFE